MRLLMDRFDSGFRGAGAKGECRPVTASGDFDLHRLPWARLNVVLGQTVSQPAYFHANHGVDLRIVVGRPLKNLGGDHRFLERFGVVFERLLYQVTKQTAAASGPGECRIGEDTVELSTNLRGPEGVGGGRHTVREFHLKRTLFPGSGSTAILAKFAAGDEKLGHKTPLNRTAAPTRI